MDENPNIEARTEYKITKERLDDLGFNGKGKVMHSLPRKNEMGHCLDETDYNLYFNQTKNSRYVFQSIFFNQFNEMLNA